MTINYISASFCFSHVYMVWMHSTAQNCMKLNIYHLFFHKYFNFCSNVYYIQLELHGYISIKLMLSEIQTVVYFIFSLDFPQELGREDYVSQRYLLWWFLLGKLKKTQEAVSPFSNILICLQTIRFKYNNASQLNQLYFSLENDISYKSNITNTLKFILNYHYVHIF